MAKAVEVKGKVAVPAAADSLIEESLAEQEQAPLAEEAPLADQPTEAAGAEQERTLPEVYQAVEELLAPIRNNAEQGLFYGSRGVAIKLRKVSRTLINDAWAKIPEPAIPVVWLDEKERNEPNPRDPAYLKAVEECGIRRGEVLAALNITLGVGECIIQEGSDLEHWDSDEWADTIETYSDVKIPAKGTKTRLVSWLRYYALENSEFGDLSYAVAMFGRGGIREADVEIAERSFQRKATRNSD